MSPLPPDDDLDHARQASLQFRVVTRTGPDVPWQRAGTSVALEAAWSIASASSAFEVEIVVRRGDRSLQYWTSQHAGTFHSDALTTPVPPPEQPVLDRPRIYVDSNESLAQDLVLLSAWDDPIHSSGARIPLRPGLRVHIYSDDAIVDSAPTFLFATGLVEENVAVDSSQSVRWCCRSDEWVR